MGRPLISRLVLITIILLLAGSLTPPRVALGQGSTPTPAAGGKSYTVQEGDTLSIIAKKFYGASSRWKEIAEANKETLPNPKKLKLGQVLVIP